MRKALMRWRIASINDLPIKADERKFHWALGRRPDDAPSLTANLGCRTPAAVILGAPKVRALNGQAAIQYSGDSGPAPAGRPGMTAQTTPPSPRPRARRPQQASSCRAESARVTELPFQVEAKPHCGLMQRFSSGTYLVASSIRRLSAVLRLKGRALGRYQSQHDALLRSLREKPQRLETARALVIVLEEIAVDIDLVEQHFGNRLVAALRGEVARRVAAADVDARRPFPPDAWQSRSLISFA